MTGKYNVYWTAGVLVGVGVCVGVTGTPEAL